MADCVVPLWQVYGPDTVHAYEYYLYKHPACVSLFPHLSYQNIWVNLDWTLPVIKKTDVVPLQD